jgi:5-methylthioadenosine/S-adenosylhomocysteine deaminase
MAGILIRHADIITLDGQRRILRDADLAIVNGVIVRVGDAAEGFGADETVDATGHILMPGFYNAHTHAALSLLRGYVSDMPLDRWLNERIWPVEPLLTGDDVYWGASLAAAEMIRAGVVGFADHYFYMGRVAEVVAECGMRASLAWCAFGGEDGEIGADLAGIARFVEEWKDAADGRIHTMLGPHSPYTCEPVFLARTAAVAARLGVGIHIHVSETADQVELTRSLHGITPVELLELNGVFDVPVLAVHASELSRTDIGILAAHRATVVQCPMAYMKLGMPLAPVALLTEAGVPVALGTESAAGRGALDMLSEARQAALLRKFVGRDASLMPGDSALRAATQVGARALGFGQSGEIAVGRRADLILIDATGPHMRPQHDLVANVLYSAQPGDVTDVMVDGRWLMRKRSLLTLDEECIMAEAERRGMALLSRPAPALLSRGPV